MFSFAFFGSNVILALPFQIRVESRNQTKALAPQRHVERKAVFLSEELFMHDLPEEQRSIPFTFLESEGGIDVPKQPTLHG